MIRPIIIASILSIQVFFLGCRTGTDAEQAPALTASGESRESDVDDSKRTKLSVRDYFLLLPQKYFELQSCREDIDWYYQSVLLYYHYRELLTIVDKDIDHDIVLLVLPRYRSTDITNPYHCIITNGRVLKQHDGSGSSSYASNAGKDGMS